MCIRDSCQSVYPDESAFQTLKERMGKLVTDQWAKGYPGNPSGLTIYLSLIHILLEK